MRLQTLRIGGTVPMRMAAWLGMVWMTAGCSLLSIDPIAPPFSEASTYGDTIREIRIEGNQTTRTWIIETAMASKVGEPYTEENAERDLRWLAGTGVFTSVQFETEAVTDGIALVVQVTEASPYLPSVSMKLTQENGIEIGPAFSSPNFLGFAGRAYAFARFGGATNFGVRYVDPWLPGSSWLFGYRLSYTHNERRNELDDFQETSDDLSFQIRRNLTHELRYGLRASYLSVASDVAGITLDPKGRDDLSGLGLFFEVDTRNGGYPTNGWYVDTEVTKYGAFGGDADYWQLNSDIRRYFPVPFGRRHSLSIYSLLTLSSGEVGTDIPTYMDYHIGGTNSVRGWPLGSRFGKNQWLGTAEYWYRLLDDEAFRFWFIRWRMGLQLAAFGDVGSAWNVGSDFEENLIGGFGGGLRLTIPVVVLLRLDASYSQERFGLQLSIGGAEKAIAQRQRVR